MKYKVLFGSAVDEDENNLLLHDNLRQLKSLDALSSAAEKKRSMTTVGT